MNTNNQNNRNQSTMTIKDIINIVWRRKFLLMIIVFVGLLSGLIAGFITQGNQAKVSTFVELEWTGITSGTYPNGQTFDYSNMFESYIFSTALSDLDIKNVSSRQLRNTIEISPIIENSVLQLIENELRQGNQINYYATEYKISLEYGKLDLSLNQGRELLNRIIQLLQEDFQRKYVTSVTVTNFIDVDFDLYDYNDSIKIIKAQIDMIETAIDVVMPEAANFQSVTLGYGFNNILVRTTLVESIQLSSIESRVANYLLSNDKEQLISQLRYDNTVLTKDMNEAIELKTEIETSISNYVGSTVNVVFPGIDQDLELDLNPYLNELYAELLNQQIIMTSSRANILWNDEMIDRLEGNDPAFIISPETDVAQKAIVDGLIVTSSEQLSTIVDDLEILLIEYRAFVNRSTIRVLVTPQYESDLSMLLYAVVGLVLGGGVGLAVVFVVDSNQKTKLNKSNEKV